MITQSGCFGNHYDPPIDDLEEAREAVADIIGSDTVENPAPCVQDPSSALAAAQVIGLTVRRVRLLTWAVVAIAVYIVLKEIK